MFAVFFPEGSPGADTTSQTTIYIYLYLPLFTIVYACIPMYTTDSSMQQVESC